MESPRPSLSFCITCKNRLAQIKQTLRQNLEDNRYGRDKIEFVLVDFGSTDGLQEWLEKNFLEDIESGYLNCFYTDELPYWHASIAKNTAHFWAKNDIVVNLDCDNFTGPKGGKFIIDKMIKYGQHHTFIHQFSNEVGDGSFGRIAVSRKNFFMMGGYDESLGPYGCEDVNLLQRLWLKGYAYIHLPDKRYCKAIPNTKTEGISNVDTDLEWWQLIQKSRRKSLENITSGKLLANKNKGHVGIISNIHKIVVTDDESSRE